MTSFLANYGLWLLIALLVLIALIFLLTGKRAKGDQESVAPVASPAPPAVEPVVEPAPAVEPPPVAEPVDPVGLVADTAAAAEVAPMAEAPIPVSPSVTAETSGDDNLLLLKGVGPKLNILLKELGVTRFSQIAAWSDADIAEIDGKLGNFKGRPVRDHWVDQAKYLAVGDTAGFEAKYGKL